MSDDDDVLVHPEYAYTKLSTKVKRGTETRDQDVTKVVTRHPDPETAVMHHEHALAVARSLADQARQIQPEVEDDG